METPSKRDFLVDTMGNCFLCSKQIPLPPNRFSSGDLKADLAPHPIHSLQQLSRYLKMDLSKVFQVKGLIQQNLLATVMNSQLKVSLCKECASLNEKLSGLCRQLEKIQMDVMHCVELVNKSLQEAIASDNKIPGSTDDNSEEGKWALSKIEIADVLRKDVIGKCRTKLSGQVPRAKIQKLTSHQVCMERMKIKLNAEKSVDVDSAPIPESFSDHEPKLEIAYLKQETPYSMTTVNGNANPEIQGRSPPAFDDEWFSDMLGNTGGFEMNMSPDPLELPVAAEQKWKPNSRRKYFGQQLHAKKHMNANIPPPVKLAGAVGNPKGQCSLNQTTGKYRCRHCPKEYTEEKNFGTHYKRVHLKVKFKCPACNQIFLYKQQYDTHYLEVHAGASFKCTTCGKSFQSKWKLEIHNRATHLGLQYRKGPQQVVPPLRIVGQKGKPEGSLDSETGRWNCQRCTLDFKTYSGFQTHYLTTHLGQRFGCTLCGKQFTQKPWYVSHYYSFHAAA